MPQGSKGTLEAWNDFGGTLEDVTWASTSVDLGGNVALVSVNEGTINDVTDESGGVQGFLSDSGDNDNVALFAGLFDPSQGSVRMECRFKQDNVLLGAIYCGFTETLTKATPVMPAEFDTATMTYNGSGGMVGALWDPDATTNRWKAVSGNGGAVSNSAVWGANGTDDSDAGDSVNDEFDIIVVEMFSSGYAIVTHDEEIIQQGQTSLTNTDLLHAVLMLENRSDAARTLEVDYFHAVGPRDWTV